MTLVEMMVAMALGSFVVVALGSLTLYSAKSFRSLADYSDLNRTSRVALDRMSREIRQSRGLVSTNSTAAMKELVFTSGGIASNTFAIRYNKAAKTLSMIKGGSTVPLLKDCTDFKFEIYQQTPQSGNFDFIQTSNRDLCKMVQMTWTCSRQVLAANKSDKVQSMQIVIRKKST
jgi:protein-arginine kinase